jgi:hypothetical protein
LIYFLVVVVGLRSKERVAVAFFELGLGWLEVDLDPVLRENVNSKRKRKRKRKMVVKKRNDGEEAYIEAVLELLRYSQDHRGDGLVPLVPRLQLLPQILVFAPPAPDPR